MLCVGLEENNISGGQMIQLYEPNYLHHIEIGALATIVM